MFQTKVKQEYIEQMERKPIQQQWLEQSLHDFSAANGEFESLKYSGELTLINQAAAKALSILRNDLLDPQNYEKLFTAVNDFMQKLYDFYFSCTEPNSPITNIVHPVKLYNVLNLVPLVIPRMYFLTIIGKIIQLSINSELEDLKDPAKLKEMQAKGVTAASLEKQSEDLVYDLVEGARGIESPTKLIFFRKFLIAQFRGIIPIKQFQQFELDNLIEMNRFWCRTAYDPARTAAEERKRDERRRYLGNIIQAGFVELAKSSQQANSPEIFTKVMEQMQICGDEMATSHLMNAIAGEMEPNELLKNINIILKTVCTEVSGASTFVKVLEKLANSKCLKEGHFDVLCSAGMDLACKIVALQKEKGQEELNRQILVGGGFESTIKSPWIAILSLLMKIGSKLWPEDLSKISFAFDLIIQVICPAMSERINQLALSLNENAICFVEEGVTVQQDNTIKITDFALNELSDTDVQSVADLMIAPFGELDESLLVPFVMLAPMVVLRAIIGADQRRKFEVSFVAQLTKKPLIDAQTFKQNREAHEQQGENAVNAAIDLLQSDYDVFAKLLHCVHGSRYLYNAILSKKVVVPQSASVTAITALFFALLRDGYTTEASNVLDFIDDVSGVQAVYLHLEAAKIDSNYRHLQKVFETYELCAISAQQNVLLGLIVNSLLTYDLQDEKETILMRCKAAAAHLLEREQRCIGMAKVAVLYKQQGLESKEVEELVEELIRKYGDATVAGMAHVILGKEQVAEPRFELSNPAAAQRERDCGNEMVEEEEVIEEEIVIEEEVIEEEFDS